MKTTKQLTIVLTLLCTSFLLNAQQTRPAKDSMATYKDTVYSLSDVDVQPEYPGGDAARREFVEKKINALVPLENGAPMGSYTVVIACFIGIDGKIIAAVPETNHGYGMEKEVLRIISKIPKPYKPALKNGVPVKTIIRFPVLFSFSTSKPEKRF